MRLSRRELALAAAGAALGARTPLARAQDQNGDEHFFIFVELRGGVHWLLATDGRDVDTLPLDDASRCVPFRITDTPPTPEEYRALAGADDDLERRSENGNYLLLPYVDDLRASYRKGVTRLGSPYVLGFAGFDLAPHVDDIAVVRGVRMLGTFHGLANNEIFSGAAATDSHHVGGVLSTLLARRLGARLLDNLVFENATYSVGTGGDARAPIRLDGNAFARLLDGGDAAGGASPAARYERSRRLALAYAGAPGLGRAEKRTLDAFARSLGVAPEILRRLDGLRDAFRDVDASLDLDLQLDTALTLMRSGLSRVVTLCLGAANGRNMVDGFGLFDAHRGLYHVNDDAGGSINTHRHHENLRKVTMSLAKLVTRLKATPFGDGRRTLWDVTTVVVGSEFARPSNFMGNESSGQTRDTAFGNGHYYYNNNYILLGRGVRGGAWIGATEPLRQMAHQVDMTTVASWDPGAIRSTPVTIEYDTERKAYVPRNLNARGDLRPIMAKDLVRTIMAIGGVERHFVDAYPSPHHADARVLAALLT